MRGVVTWLRWTVLEFHARKPDPASSLTPILGARTWPGADADPAAQRRWAQARLHASTGRFEIWRNIRIAHVFLKREGVDCFSLATVQPYYDKAFVNIEWDERIEYFAEDEYRGFLLEAARNQAASGLDDLIKRHGIDHPDRQMGTPAAVRFRARQAFEEAYLDAGIEAELHDNRDRYRAVEVRERRAAARRNVGERLETDELKRATLRIESDALSGPVLVPIQLVAWKSIRYDVDIQNGPDFHLSHPEVKRVTITSRGNDPVKIGNMGLARVPAHADVTLRGAPRGVTTLTPGQSLSCEIVYSGVSSAGGMSCVAWLSNAPADKANQTERRTLLRIA